MTIETDIKEEVARAERNLPEYNSYHEGYALILEKMDELWDLIKDRNSVPFAHYLKAKYIACIAIRYMKMCRKKQS